MSHVLSFLISLGLVCIVYLALVVCLWVFDLVSGHD